MKGFEIGDKVRIVRGFCFTSYLKSVPTSGVIVGDTADLPSGHGDWLVETQESIGCFACDESDLEKE